MRNLLHVAVLLMSSLFAGCTSSVFTPTALPNPWADDYSSLSPMESYQSWGTYNVHDPSCRKIGDYYYNMYFYGMPSSGRIVKKQRKKGGAFGLYSDAPFQKTRRIWEFWLGHCRDTQEGGRGCALTGRRAGATNIWDLISFPIIISIGYTIVLSALGRKLKISEPATVYKNNYNVFSKVCDYFTAETFRVQLGFCISKRKVIL